MGGMVRGYSSHPWTTLCETDARQRASLTRRHRLTSLACVFDSKTDQDPYPPASLLGKTIAGALRYQDGLRQDFRRRGHMRSVESRQHCTDPPLHRRP
jgi:hypothetical protein